MLDLGQIRFIRRVILAKLAQLDGLELRRALAAIGNRIRRDAKQPGRKGGAAPFEVRKIFQRAMENVAGKVLGLIAIAHPPRDEGIHAFKVLLVEPREAGGIALRGLDETALGCVLAAALQCGFGSHLRRSPAISRKLGPSDYINRRAAKRLRGLDSSA